MAEEHHGSVEYADAGKRILIIGAEPPKVRMSRMKHKTAMINGEETF